MCAATLVHFPASIHGGHQGQETRSHGGHKESAGDTGSQCRQDPWALHLSEPMIGGISWANGRRSFERFQEL